MYNMTHAQDELVFDVFLQYYIHHNQLFSNALATAPTYTLMALWQLDTLCAS